MIFITLQGNDTKQEHIVKITIDNPESLFNIDKQTIVVNTKNLFEDLFAYEHNRSADIPFIDRDFFKYFHKYNNNICIVNMLRCFAVSNSYLQFHLSDFNDLSDKMQENKIKTAKKYFASDKGTLLIDWTEKEESQPQIFFIQKVLMNSHDIHGLYSLQLLQKYSISYKKETVDAMYVPFVYPDISNLKIINCYSTWKKIVKGINDEVSRLVNNWDHK